MCSYRKSLCHGRSLEILKNRRSQKPKLSSKVQSYAVKLLLAGCQGYGVFWKWSINRFRGCGGVIDFEGGGHDPKIKLVQISDFQSFASLGVKHWLGS